MIEMIKWLVKYFWGLLLVALPAIFCTAFPFFIFYLGTEELALSAWNASPVKVNHRKIFIRVCSDNCYYFIGYHKCVSCSMLSDE